jgi:hypothetical protein
LSASPAGATIAVDRPDHLTRIVIGLDVRDDQVAPRVGEGAGVAQWLRDHQVAWYGTDAIGRTACTTTGPIVRFSTKWPVHHVEMDRVDASPRPRDAPRRPAERSRR